MMLIFEFILVSDQKINGRKVDVYDHFDFEEEIETESESESEPECHEESDDNEDDAQIEIEKLLAKRHCSGILSRIFIRCASATVGINFLTSSKTIKVTHLLSLP